MAELIFVYGPSGAGKSRSLINFGDDEILYVNVVGKRLPMRKKFTYTIQTDDVGKIISKLEGMSKAGIKTAVIDDAGYLMTSAFMKGHGKGDQFKLFNEIADSFWSLINSIKRLPDDVNVYIVMHEEQNDFGNTRLRTIGKLLDQKVCLQGMATVCIRCLVKNGEHIFSTQNCGSDVSKAPEGMFDADELPNDLKAVDEKIRAYYEM